MVLLLTPVVSMMQYTLCSLAMLFMLVGLLLHAVGIQDSRSIPTTMNSYRYSYIT